MASFLLYDKKVKLSFKDQGHRYQVSFLLEEGHWSEPREVPGVTTIKDLISKPALLPWAANLAASTYTQLLKKAGAMDGATLIEIEKQAKVAHTQARDAGGSRGTDFHSAVELFLKGEKIPKLTDEVDKMFTSFREWWMAVGYKPLMIEQALYSRNLNLAGTLDILAETPKGAKILVSLKTSSNIYVTDFLQDGGYALMLKEMFDLNVDDIEIFNPRVSQLTKRASEFGMSVSQAITYFDRIHAAWMSHRDWELSFKR